MQRSLHDGLAVAVISSGCTTATLNGVMLIQANLSGPVDKQHLKMDNGTTSLQHDQDHQALSTSTVYSKHKAVLSLHRMPIALFLVVTQAVLADHTVAQWMT